MRVPRSQIVPAVAKLTDSGKPEAELAKELAAYLLTTGRTGELDSLARDLISLRVSQGVVEVTAVSAMKLSPETVQQVKVKVQSYYPEAKQIIISERRDSSAVGGVRLELPGKQLDLTVRGKLTRLKQLTAAGA